MIKYSSNLKNSSKRLLKQFFTWHLIFSPFGAVAAERECSKVLGHLRFSEVVRQEIARAPDEIQLDFKYAGIEVELINESTRHRKYLPTNPLELGDVWLTMKIGRGLQASEIERLVRHFTALSRPKKAEAGITDFESNFIKTNTMSVQDGLMNLTQLSNHKDGLVSLEEMGRAPKVDFNDRIVDGPIKLPPHAWRRLYFSFENEIVGYPEFGLSIYGIVVASDGIKVRIGRRANFFHSIAPQLEKTLQSLPPTTSVGTMEQVAATALQESKVTSKKELFQHLANAGEPLVPVQEIEDVIKLMLQFR